MSKVSDVKLKNLLQDYRKERAALLGPESDRLYALIHERYNQYPAEGDALIAVFKDQAIRSELLAPAGRLTATEVADKVKVVGQTSRPDLIRGAIETWADALGVKIVDNAPAPTPQQPKKEPVTAAAAEAESRAGQAMLSVAAIALGLFITGGEVLDNFFHRTAVEDLNANRTILSHPIQYLMDNPLSVLGYLFFMGGIIGFFNSFKRS